VSEGARDKWADWLLERRHGGDPAGLEQTKRQLAPVRDRVLDNAAVREGDVLLDVGCGDGLVGFGAIDRVGESGRVLFSDVSRALLDHARSLADEAGVSDRCEFVQARAEELSPFPDESVDVVTTRSVVIYVPADDKRRALEAFFRVLKPGGRLSMFEPINRFAYPEPENRLFGFDVTPILPVVRKLKAAHPGGDDTLLDFDERDLLAFAERAGFRELVLSYEARIEHGGGMSWGATTSWETFVHSSGNPCAPTLAESLDTELTPAERDEFVAYFRPLYEAGKGTVRMAITYLRAVKAL
jgi:arsenite methyltransferase